MFLPVVLAGRRNNSIAKNRQSVPTCYNDVLRVLWIFYSIQFSSLFIYMLTQQPKAHNKVSTNETKKQNEHIYARITGFSDFVHRPVFYKL
jgi:hypothetical protein